MLARYMPDVLKVSAMLPSGSTRDDAAVAAHGGQLLPDDLVGGLGEAGVAVLHAGADIARDRRADEVLAMAGSADGAGAVVGIGAGADDRRIADATPLLVGHAAGRSACGEVAVTVQRHRANGREPRGRAFPTGRSHPGRLLAFAFCSCCQR